MMRIPDAASLAAMRVLSRRLGRKVGGSTGTNFFGLCLIAARMQETGVRGSLVTLICDGGERYANSYYNDDWLAAEGLDLAPFERALTSLLETGQFSSLAEC